MSMYCYFEALGVGFRIQMPDGDDGEIIIITADNIYPWLRSNSVMINHFTLPAVLAVTLLADSRISLNAVLRGLAPLYVKVGLALLFVASLISLAMFAGQEFSIQQERSVYHVYLVAYVTFLLLWVLIGSIMAAGRISQDRTAKVDGLTTPAARGSSEEKGDDEQGRSALSNTAVSGGATRIVFKLTSHSLNNY